MFSSDRFLKIAHKYLKEHRETDSEVEKLDSLCDLARGRMDHLPAELTDELLDHFRDRVEEHGDGPERLARHLADVVDLFKGEYDEQNDPFDRRDWEAVGSAVSDTALDLDMDTVNYVMRLVVDHHGV